MAIVPNLDQFRSLATSPESGPVVMLNLLKFKDRVEGEDATGAEAYARYAERTSKMIEELGGKILWTGCADQTLIGDPTQDWDMVALVRYPSRHAFIQMVSSPAYQEGHRDRERRLLRTVLVACTPIAGHLNAPA